jgi:hypothetical protein
LAGFEPCVCAVFDQVSRTPKDSYFRRLIAISNCDVVDPRPEQPNAALWKIDLDDFGVSELAEVKPDAPLMQRNLGEPMVQIGKPGFGAIGQADRIGADPNLRAGSRIGSQRLAGKHRLVGFGVAPSGLIRSAQRNVAGR